MSTTRDGDRGCRLLHHQFTPDQDCRRSRLRHYTNLAKMESRIERLLNDFRFSTLSDVCNGLKSYRDGPTVPPPP